MSQLQETCSTTCSWVQLPNGADSNSASSSGRVTIVSSSDSSHSNDAAPTPADVRDHLRQLRFDPQPLSSCVTPQPESKPYSCGPRDSFYLRSCKLCEDRLRNVLWKCLRCPDWNACDTCSPHVLEVHPSHSFVRISAPGDILASASDPRISDPITHNGLKCSACLEPIVGDRYECAAVSCPSFNMCASCEADPNGCHPLSHPLIKYRLPAEYSLVASKLDQVALDRRIAKELLIEEARAIREDSNSVQAKNHAGEETDAPNAMPQKSNFFSVQYLLKDLDALLLRATKIAPKEPGQSFTARWLVKNVGRNAWPVDIGIRRLSPGVCERTDNAAPGAVSPPFQFWAHRVRPNSIAEAVSPLLLAPITPGDYTEKWTLCTVDGEPIGPPLVFSMTVTQDGADEGHPLPPSTLES